MDSPIQHIPKGSKIGDYLLNHLKVRARQQAQDRRRPRVEKGILSDGKFAELAKEAQKFGFTDVMKTTLGNDFSAQGLLRSITLEDLQNFDRKINALEAKYQGGIKPAEIINASQPIDRQRATREIPWAHPTASRYLASKGALVVTFTTAASGKNREKMHFVNVEFGQYKQIITHRLMLEPSKSQADLDINQLQSSLIKFDCDCGRHTYWYRFIASKGKFAYIGSNPIGREESGFPKIRNPQLKGIACKHVIRTMKAILQDAGFRNFMRKAIMKHYGQLDTKKNLTTQTTKKEMTAAIKRQSQASGEILSEKEQRINRQLLDRYQQALSSGLLMRNAKDKRTTAQKLAVLAKIHNIDHYLKLIK